MTQEESEREREESVRERRKRRKVEVNGGEQSGSMQLMESPMVEEGKRRTRRSFFVRFFVLLSSHHLSSVFTSTVSIMSIF